MPEYGLPSLVADPEFDLCEACRLDAIHRQRTAPGHADRRLTHHPEEVARPSTLWMTCTMSTKPARGGAEVQQAPVGFCWPRMRGRRVSRHEQVGLKRVRGWGPTDQ